MSALALVLSLAPHTLAAQGSYTAQLQGYMNNYSGPILNSGFQVVTPMVTNGINGGATANHPVTMNAGRQYVILGVCDNDCSDLDLRLYGPDGSQIIQDIALDDHPTLRLMAPVTGSYRLDVIMATCRQNPCYYGVQLFGGAMGGVAMNQPQPMGMPQPMAMNMAAPTAMGQIASNQQVSGNLTSMDGRWDNKPTQTWAFACNAGQSFQMDVLSTWDNYAIVFDPMNTPVARNDDDGDGLNARINHTCAMTGVYRLGVTTYTANTAPGAYTLQVQSMMQTAMQPMAQPMATPQPLPMPVQQAAPGATMPAPSPTPGIVGGITGGIPAPGQVGHISPGTNVQGRLETGDQRMNDGTWADVWQFNGAPGQHVVIELRSEEFDTYVQLMDASGNKLAEDDDSLGDMNSKVEVTLNAAGVYQIIVKNFSDERRAGIYTLTLR